MLCKSLHVHMMLNNVTDKLEITLFFSINKTSTYQTAPHHELVEIQQSLVVTSSITSVMLFRHKMEAGVVRVCVLSIRITTRKPHPLQYALKCRHMFTPLVAALLTQTLARTPTWPFPELLERLGALHKHPESRE